MDEEELQIDIFLQDEEDLEVILSEEDKKIKRDEDNYLELIEKGIDEKKAAHMINRIAEKRLKNKM